jgi:glutamate--cysteine ligase
MMRATASAQVSGDYTSEADAVRKFRIANALGPLLAFITDNSPVFEGRSVGSGGVGSTGLAIPERMVRTVIWDDVDASRSMIAPHTFDKGFDFATYAASVLSAPAIFTLEDDGQSGDAGGGAGGERRGTGGGRQGAGGGTGGGAKRGVPQGGRSFAEALAGRELDRATIEHILSLFFFDVRFKTYIEIRMADSLPIDYALAFVALIKGLFYREGNLRRLEALLGWAEWPADLLADPLAGQPIEQPAELLAGQAAELLAGHGEQAARVDAAAVAAAKAALRSEGYGALVYQRSAAAWLDELIAMARQGLDGTEAPYLEPLARLVADRTTLVDVANDGDVANAVNGGGAL